MKSYLFSLFFVISITGMRSQNKLENTYYVLPLPAKITTELFQSTNEALANIDSYKIIVDNKPICIFYMMSNKLQTCKNVEMTNYKDFLFDIVDVNITKTENFKDFIKVYFKYKEKANIDCVVYIGIKGDILNRFLVMYPNSNALMKFDEEVNTLLNQIIYKKKNW